MIIRIVFFLVALGINSVGHAQDPLRVLNWWDYIAPKIVSDYREEGTNISLKVYKSNDFAVSELISPSHDYDVAILSSVVIPKLFETGLITYDFSKDKSVSVRRYYPFLKGGPCVPYLWSSTLYVARNVSKKIVLLSDLYKAKRDGVSVGLIDDKFEVLGRWVGDNALGCDKQASGQNIFGRIKTCKLTKSSSVKEFTPDSYINSAGDFIKNNKRSAVYGWSGEFGKILEDKSVDFYLPKENPIVGFDGVCVVSKDLNEAKITQLKKFILNLTSRDKTHVNVAFSNYFSPYINDSSNLSKAYKGMLEQLTKKDNIKMLGTVSGDMAAGINDWWERVRYARKRH